MHSKQALLSALITDLRQSEVASCFATSIAIMTHDQNPLQTATELKQIIENGKFEKIVDGEIKTFDIPKIYIPTQTEFRPSYLDIFYPKSFSFEKFLEEEPEIKKVIAMVGLDISKKEDLMKLELMSNEALNASPKVEYGYGPSTVKLKKDVILKFINQLAMYKHGLEEGDFKKRNEYEKKIIEKDRLTRKLEKAPTNDENQLLLDQIEVIRKEMDEIHSYFDQKFGVGAKLIESFEAYDEFKQKLEMSYQSAIGENALLRIWEYSIASNGISFFKNISFKKTLEDTLTYTPFTFDPRPLISYPVNTLAWLFGMPQIMRNGTIARNASVQYMLKTILDETENSDNDFDKVQFQDEFNKNFKDILAKRLEIKYEGGHFRFYDKTRATSMSLSIPLEDPMAICETIASIAYHAGENINTGNPDIKNQVLTQLSLMIQETSDIDSTKPLFFKNLISALEESLESTKSIEQALSFDRGLIEPILEQYIGGFQKTMEKTITGTTPVHFIVGIVSELDAMIKEGRLNKIDPNTQIMFPVIKPGHGFLFRPNMTMLAELMEDTRTEAIEAWIQKRLIDEQQPFIFGDLNWVENGSHRLLVISNDEESGRLYFYNIPESTINTSKKYKVDDQMEFNTLRFLFPYNLNSG